LNPAADCVHHRLPVIPNLKFHSILKYDKLHAFSGKNEEIYLVSSSTKNVNEVRCGLNIYTHTKLLLLDSIPSL
jgi:hypothetical protein